VLPPGAAPSGRTIVTAVGPHRRRIAVGALVGWAVAVGLGACAPTSDPTPGATSASATASTVEIPDTPTGRATTWVLDQLAASEGPAASAAEAVFAPVFLAEIPAGDVAGVFDRLRALGPFTVTAYTEVPVGTAATARTSVRGTAAYVLTVSTDADELIQGLWLAPATESPQIDSTDDVGAAIREVADDGSFLLARVTGEGAAAECVPAASYRADALRPVGSVFKLYVLGAVVQAVADGALAWTDRLTLTEELRSLPSGRLQDEPAGTRVSVLEAAEAMIAISDNTASDLLVDAVGRDAVEEAVARMGHSEPEVLTPFLTTREMFLLAFTSEQLRREWAAATGADPLSVDPQVSERQRALVESLAGREAVLDEALLASPAWPDGLDWFADAADVCRAHLALQSLADTPAGRPVRRILSRNPGLTTATAYDEVAFKGGSAPGEIAGSWYVVSGDERRVVVVTAASAAQPAPDGGWLVAVADQVLAADLESPSGAPPTPD
jgi:beta-lactamase class A